MDYSLLVGIHNIDQAVVAGGGGEWCSNSGTPTKRQVSKRWFQNVQFLNLVYLLNKKYRNCQICIAILSKECVIITFYGDIWQKNPLK
jgi:hypothetical protein